MNLQGLLNINKKIMSALEGAHSVVATPTQALGNNTDYSIAADTFEKLGCGFAPICICDGVLCVGADEKQVEKALLSGEKPIQLSELPLAIALKKTACLCASATSLVAGLCSIKVVCTPIIGGKSLDFLQQDISALRSNPVLLIGYAADDTLQKVKNLGLPAYRHNEYNNDTIAKICEAKWNLGISSGVMYSSDKANLYQNAAQCAKYL